MKIILDTNILVSAFTSKLEHSTKIINLISLLEELQSISSAPILDEVKNILSRTEVKTRFNYSTHEVEAFTSSIRDASTILKLKSNFKVIKEDQEDDGVLNTAYDGKVEYIVSGDHHLKNLGKFKGIKIVSPKQMLKIITRRFGELII